MSPYRDQPVLPRTDNDDAAIIRAMSPWRPSYVAMTLLLSLPTLIFVALSVRPTTPAGITIGIVIALCMGALKAVAMRKRLEGRD